MIVCECVCACVRECVSKHFCFCFCFCFCFYFCFCLTYLYPFRYTHLSIQIKYAIHGGWLWLWFGFVFRFALNLVCSKSNFCRCNPRSLIIVLPVVKSLNVMIRQVLSCSVAVRWIVFTHMFALIVHGVHDDIIGQLNWVRAVGVIMSPLNARISMHIHLLRSKCRIRFAPFFRSLFFMIHDIPPQRVSRLGSHRIMIVLGNTNFTICANDKSRVG